MKRTLANLLFVAALLLGTLNLHAQSPAPPAPNRAIRIPLAWEPSPTLSVVGYRLYHATSGPTWTNHTFIAGRTNTTFTFTNGVPGVSNHFVVMAVNADGVESDPSNVVQRPALPVPASAGPLQALPVTVTLRWQPPDAEWADLATLHKVVLVNLDKHQRGNFSARVDIGDPVPLVTTP